MSSNSENKIRNSKLERLVSALLSWFAHNARDLPWRRTRDPYAIWISEIMLQQTQVKTVIPFWQRWMKSLPTIETLARAKPEKVLKLWEGLGYYTRARNLQKAAQEICATHAGKFPENFDDILPLPGIGRYTAGAISSIAFNQPKPILDGNVIRVLTRVFGIAKNPREKETNARLWQLAEQLVSFAAKLEKRSRRPPFVIRHSSHFNQSLMELGALICIPRQPKCNVCPIRKLCVAFREDCAEQLPSFAPRPKPTSRRFIAFVLSRRKRFFVRQRPKNVVNGQLWEFPNVEVFSQSIDIAETAQNLFGFSPKKLTSLCSIKHSITRYRITLEAHRTTLRNNSIAAKNSRWLTLAELEKLAFTSAHRKILAHLRHICSSKPTNQAHQNL